MVKEYAWTEEEFMKMQLEIRKIPGVVSSGKKHVGKDEKSMCVRLEIL